jgi:carbamoyltransferase
MNHISIYGGHNATISFYNSDKDIFHNIELERVTRIRYFHLSSVPREEAKKVLLECLEIAKKFWGIDNDFETCTLGTDGAVHDNLIYEIIKANSFYIEDHHDSHASCAFFQTKFEESLIISYDGGGNDGTFNIYLGKADSIRLIKSIPINLGHAYLLTGYPCSEIKRKEESLYSKLAISGKLMGLVAYGKEREEWKEHFYNFYNRNRGWSIANLISNTTKVGGLKGKISYDFAATSQAIFEKICFDVFGDLIDFYNPKNICLTGGCALNVLFNHKLATKYSDINFYIPPNPDDGGLSLGQLFSALSKNGFEFTRPEDIHLSGVPILDIDKLEKYVEEYDAKRVTEKELAEIVSNGKIIGIIQGNSECGPRALGNRSIVCKASPGMKDTLNAKVKFREWFRPFAPVTTPDNAHLFFDVKNMTSKNVGSYKYMSYAPKVLEDKQSLIPSVTHADGTSRLQIINDESTVFYKLVKELEKLDEIPVFINTSFNIKGKPILSTIREALEVLHSTELDYVYVEGWLFNK